MKSVFSRCLGLAASGVMIGVVIFAAGPGAFAAAPQVQTAEPAAVTFAQKELNDYARRLGEIASDRPECLTWAVEEYQKSFAGKRAGLCDSAYLILEDFASFGIDLVNFNLPLSEEESGEAGEKYRRNLERNYFKIVKGENGLRAEADLFALQTRLREFLSPETFEFLQGVEREKLRNTARLSPEKLAEGACFWEDFVTKYPMNLFAPEAHDRRDAYLDALIFGNEAFPLFDEKGKINADYREVLQGLEKEFQQGKKASKTHQVAHKFWEILSHENFTDGPEIWMFTF